MIYRLLGALILLIGTYFGGRGDGQRVERASYLKQREVARLAAELASQRADDRYRELSGTARQSITLLGQILDRPLAIPKETLVKEVPVEVPGKCYDRSAEYRVLYNSIGSDPTPDSPRTLPGTPNRDSSL